jgi:cellulase/cellobiase CelA1
MATNAAPIYGKQYIRYAETFEAAVDAEIGSPAEAAAGTNVGIVEIGELHVVTYVSSAGPNVAAQPDALAPGNWTGLIAGVNQAYMPTALAQPYTARQLTIATSGLLLIDVDPASAVISINTALQVNDAGQAVAAGTAVTLDGTTPIVRENITIGGRRLALVSFA